jgi:xylulose-5-phosphate/fructose-6-phosphate phosphoketolase
MRERAPGLIDTCMSLIAKARAYSREHLEDAPEISDWVWTETPVGV